MYMRIISAAVLLGTASAPPSIAIAAAAPSAPSSVCGNLSSQYDLAEKNLALTFAEGVGDDSAPRETYRQIQSSNYLSTAMIVVTLMEAHHCALPDHAPSPSRYATAALICATDQLKEGPGAASCKMDNWGPHN